MSENDPVECSVAQEVTKPPVKIRKKRDIFRFSALDQEMAIDLEKVYKIVQKGRKVLFILPLTLPVAPDREPGDWIEFEEEEAAKRAFDQITGIWSADVLDGNCP